MSRQKKLHGLWNILIILTVIICIIAFVVHYKNWTKVNGNHIQILSGIYYKKLPFSELDSIMMVPKIPAMERINGFSVKNREKGVFIDSISGSRTYVYVDDLRQPKIRLIYKDSLQLFLNFTDSVRTKDMYEFLSAKIDSIQE
ncbi:MAG: hypothetical protein AAFZ89_12970 [Bacteroidota bacterium]